jgi:NitT/TauT family transport system ATP-binding protein
MGQGQLDAIEVRDVTRRFSIAKSPLVALERVSFRVPQGQVVAVLGPNGSGKSTLLRLIAGVLAPDEGSVLIQATQVAGPDARVGLAFQEPRLLPWRTVLDNVAFPLELAGWERGRREARARELLDRVGVVGFERAHPAQLSGGLSQRVGIARALALGPPVLLLDEPFSALDSLTRDRLNLELLRLWEATGSTVVLVTHSIPEAVFLADRVLVLSPRPGRLIADIPVDLPRPRDPAAVDTAGFSAAAIRIREVLSADIDATAGSDTGSPRDEVAA